MADEGFLKRWARLKAAPEQAPVVAPVPAPAVATVVAPVPAPAVATAAIAPAPLDGADAVAPAPEVAPPTIADAAALTADSDFSVFVGKNVDAAVRRLAMKKLFADPHFHGHDGLDIYMGDYNLPSPVSADMLAQMTHNKNIFAKLDDALDRLDALVDTDQAASPVPVPVPAPAPVHAPLPDTPETAAPAPPSPDQEAA
ncbi:DUF3306 domain-containing protein [Massilia sp. DWR3-1-1]|uniref:DUF3306 domain-containing protein n=1 Tax=Massilia sp. DWR3-1-1 TaxID=2804559 RepID=UPI003CF77B6A